MIINSKSLVVAVVCFYLQGQVQLINTTEEKNSDIEIGSFTLAFIKES